MEASGIIREYAAAGRSPFYVDEEERLEDEFRNAHMQHLRFFIGVWHCRAQQRENDPQNATEDDEEFEMELQNFFDLLVNPRLRSADVLHATRLSLNRYVDAWPEANEAIARWWSPRRDKETALRTDMQLVAPGIWIGSASAIKPVNQGVLQAMRIRHVVKCSTSRPDGDDDFEHGVSHAAELSLDDADRTFPAIKSAKDGGAFGLHGIELHEVGFMGFLVRRRDHALSKRSNEAWTTICRFLHELLEQTHRQDGHYVDQFDGVLLCCDSGTCTSVAVCIAVLMSELWLPYDVGLRLINSARLYVAPTKFFEHQLREYERHLASERSNMELPVLTRSIS